MTRRHELQNFQADVQGWYDFLNATGPDKAIQIIDPEQELEWFGKHLEKVIGWAKKEIEKEHELEGEALPDEGERVMWRVNE